MPSRSKPRPSVPDPTLELAALMGREFSLPLLHAAAGSRRGTDTHFESGLLIHTDNPNCARFARDADLKRLEKSIPWSRRRAHFQCLGEAAERLRLPPSEIAIFFEQSQDLVRARDWWRRAAEKACSTGDYANAAVWLDRALTLWPWSDSPDERVNVLREGARCATNSGETDACRRIWMELADYANDSGQFSLLVEAHRQLATLAGDPAQTTEHLKRAAEVAEKSLSPKEAAHEFLNYIEHLAERTLTSIARRALKRAVPLAEASADAAVLSEMRGWQGLIDAMSGKHKTAEAFVEESLHLALENDLKEQAAIAYRRRANIQDYRGHYVAEQKSQLAAIEFCRTSKAGDELVCMGCLSYACFRTGDFQGAIQSAREVLRDANEAPVLRAMGACVLGLIHAFRGERRPAAGHLNDALECFQQTGFVGMEFFALWGQAYLRHTEGDSPGACEYFDRIRMLWRESDDLHDVIPAMLFAGGVYAEAGLEEQLVDCLDIVERVVRKNPLGEAKATRAMLRAELAHLRSQHDDVQSALADALKRHQSLELPVERLWVEYRAKQIGGFVASPDAAALAKRLGMRPMLSVLQERAGSTVDSDLTPRQQEVLKHLAKGLTSKEIADRLSLSTRTVEMHVGRLLSRMNCRTRPEAVREATERGWL